MAFHNLMIKLTAEARVCLAQSSAPTVIELGNQTFRMKGRATLDQAHAFLDAGGIDHRADELKALARRFAAGDRDRLTERYYRAIGFASYAAIDVNARYGSLIMDLNNDLQAHYGFVQQFDLVTNNGTGEHIFDQVAVLKNVHALTRPGGIMIHCLPCNNWINHGFYSFSPIVFLDLAGVNEYEILKITVAENNGTESGFVSDHMPAHFPCIERLSLTDLQQRVSDRHPRPYLVAWFKNVTGLRRGKGPFPLERAVRRLSNRHPKTSVVAVLRKRTAGEFRKPIQGRYGGANIESAAVRRTYVR